MSRQHPTVLTGGRLLARNVLWNLAGQLVPLAVAVVAAPLLINGLGLERFGVLSLSWTVIGYFSLFDLGLGRALTKVVAERSAERPGPELGAIAWTGLVLLLALGVVGMGVTWLLAPWLVRDALEITKALESESLLSLYALAAGIPFLTLTSGLRGLMEGAQHFTAVNLIRLPMNLLMLLGPLAVLPFSRSLVPVVLALVGIRLGAAVVHLVVCLRIFPEMRSRVVLDPTVVLPVVRLGGWMTVTSVVGPLLIYLDRFFIGFIVSVSAVTYYAAPFDVITRFLVFPIALVGVLFPAFASSVSVDRERANLLLARGTKYVLISVLPFLLIPVVLAPEILRVWLGPSFETHSSAALRWLAAGVLANGVAHVPFAFLQAAGRPDLTAKLHIFELPFYLLGLAALTMSFGITGAAIAWTARSVIDGVVLFALVRRVLPESRVFIGRVFWASVGSAGLLLAGVAPIGGIAAKLVFLAAAIGVICYLAWRSMSVEERTFFLSGAAAFR